MLIIFDCDGVLVDSEMLAADIFSKALRKEGLIFSTSQCLNVFKGKTLSACYNYIESELAFSLPSNFDKALKEQTKDVFAQKLKAVRGVSTLLAYLSKQGIAFCVASNGGYDKIKHALTITGLASFFDDNIFSAEQVEKGKPAPDLFLLAAKTMGYGASVSWVVEDSHTGILAAREAGMTCIEYLAPNIAGGGSCAPADYQVSDIVQIKDIIAKGSLG